MKVTQTSDLLVRRLTEAYEGGAAETAPHRIEAVLVELCASRALELPDHAIEASRDRYARHLLHRDERGRFSLIAMVWGPGQGTPLHDHDGHWCVECVYSGEMDSEAFRPLASDRAGRVRFDSLHAERGGPGASGVLLPPLQYHVMRNPSSTETAVTLHVYEGELERCRVFHPEADGWYRPEVRTLSYTS